MKKLLNTMSHLVVIGLALMALLIATVVWAFERLRWHRGASESADHAYLTAADNAGTTALEFEDDPRSNLAATGEVGD